MATDIAQIVESLSRFYDFAGRSVVWVGAGPGQLVAFAGPARRVVALDKDAAALARLEARLAESGPSDKFVLLTGELLELRPSGDVLLFEFCLHQMAEPDRALDHARELAPDVLVLDHAPGSRWSWCAAEDGQVAAAWQAVERRTIRRQRTVGAFQLFADYAELEARLAAQGPLSHERIAALRGQQGISIPMPCRLVLL